MKRSSAWRWVAMAAVLWMSGAPLVAQAQPGSELNCRRWPVEDAVWLARSGEAPQVECHADRPLVPASTLKIATALVALHVLGQAYRFPTDVYQTPDNDLVIKGYGDPLLVSESLAVLAGQIMAALGESTPAFRNVIVDSTYFASEPPIPGTRKSRQPYDSPTGAVCVNFNTVLFTRQDGRILSAEPQTPLIAFARERIRRFQLPSGRLLLNQTTDEARYYAGHLIAYFLRKAGMTLTGSVQMGRVSPERDHLLVRYESSETLDHVIKRMMRYSNNFIANQLFLAAGAVRYGAPATLAKSRRAAQEVLSGIPGASAVVMQEGSGLSRDNRLSARQLGALMTAFSPWRRLLRFDDGDPGHGYKTGTLMGIRNRVGFMTDAAGRQYHYAVMLNSGRQSMADVLSRLRAWIAASEPRP